MVFGRKSERFVAQPAAEQLNIFATEDDSPAQPSSEPLRKRIKYERDKPVATKKHPGRTPLPEHFEVEELTLEPQEDTTGMVRIGEHISEYVEYTPAAMKIIRIIRPKYFVQRDSRVDKTTPVLCAQLPARPIDKSIASASLLAHIITNKYIDHLPFLPANPAF